jgi:NitT/TauT family transport system substrate-binding protein
MSVSSPLVLALAINNAHVDLQVVADVAQDGVEGYHSETIIARKDSGINTLEDIRGKRLATSAIGSSTDTAMRVYFLKNGLVDKKDYTTLEVAFSNIPAMLDEKKVDLGPVIQPFLGPMMASGNYKVVFRQKDGIGPSQVVFLAARGEFLEAHRQALYDFFEDHVRAMRWFMDPKNKAEATAIIGKFMKQPPENLAYMFTRNDYYRDPFLFPNVPNIQTPIDLAYQYKLAPSKIDVAPKYVDLSFIQEAKKRIEADPK